MRKTMLLAAITAMTFSAPSFAGMMPDAASIPPASAVELATHNYWHKPKCFFKKIKKHDYYGNVIIKKVKVCR